MRRRSLKAPECCLAPAELMRLLKVGAPSPSPRNFSRQGAYRLLPRCCCSTPVAALRTDSRRMRIAILDPFSGISGDMALGALIQLGLPANWLEELPNILGLDGVVVRIRGEARCGVDCKKVDFDIPPQPHGRHLHQIRDLVNRSPAPVSVKERADAVFTAIAQAEA